MESASSLVVQEIVAPVAVSLEIVISEIVGGVVSPGSGDSWVVKE
jgi:hypothetical protein